MFISFAVLHPADWLVALLPTAGSSSRRSYAIAWLCFAIHIGLVERSDIALQRALAEGQARWEQEAAGRPPRPRRPRRPAVKDHAPS